jgi:hypothetical protein
MAKTTYVRVSAMMLFAAILALLPARAQNVSGVRGVVTDSTGAVISGVTVELDNPGRGLHFAATTDDLGAYQIQRVPPATGYILTFTKDGFRKLTLSDLALGVNTTETRNVTLELGNVTQSIEVKATGEATLNTSDASIGNNIDTNRLRDLPVQFRNSPAALLGLQPGVTPNTGEGETQVGAVTGSRVDQTNIMLDGLDVNDNTIGQAFTLVGNAPIDSIQEFRTVTANDGAEQGRSAGGQVLLVTKSGTNDWHGSAREYHRNTVTAANSFFNNKNGLARPPLIRNQFGGNVGGKIIRDKLFFFFDYDGLHEAASSSNLRTVPLPSLLLGKLGYQNDQGGVSFLSAAQVAGLDPQGIGASQAVLDLWKSRYPGTNTSDAGDGINTGGFTFTTPTHNVEDDYVARVDYIVSDKHKIFLRGNLARDTVDDFFNHAIKQFPSDTAVNSQLLQRDYTYIIGYTWNLTPNKINQFGFGVSNQYLNFPFNFQPTAPNFYTFNGFVSSPFQNFTNAQSRKVPTPTFRDDFTYIRGKHTLQFGGTFKPIRDNETQITDINSVGIGLGGNLLSLDNSSPDLRPADIAKNPDGTPTTAATALYDGAFAALLGRFSSVNTVFDYSKNGQPLPNLTGTRRKYVYNEGELYAQDTWRVRNDLSLTLGLRWEYHQVPYEANGLEAISNQDFRQFFAHRVQNAANGISGVAAEPFYSFDLAGKANNRPGYYNPDYRDFDPRVGIAWNPSFTHGLLGDVLGNRKTSIRLGGGIVHDRVLQTLSFILNQASFIFDSTATLPFGTPGDPNASFKTDPRFSDLKSLPATPAAPVITRPDTPFVDANGIPTGTAAGNVSFAAMDQHFKTPYEYTFSFGIQRELPGHMIVEADYVGRLGRKLLAQADYSQIVDFKDKTSGQFLRAAFGGLEKQIQAGVAGPQITPQPWFESQMNSAIAANFGSIGINNCADYGLAINRNTPTCTRLARVLAFGLLGVGDVSDTVQQLLANGVLDFNVGLSAQVPYNAVLGNYSSSNYNALLLTLKKTFSNNLQFDFDYTYSHSIDNQSTNQRQIFGFGGQVCDLQNLRACRGSSDFDARHIISANWTYNLPVGRGQHFGRNMPRALDAAIGGWEVAGIWSWHTGFPFNLNTGSFPVGFTNDSAPLITGSLSALASSIHTDAKGKLQFFKDPDAARAALGFPEAGQTGSRNSVTGPGFTNVDLGILKHFNMPWKEGHRLTFRCDMFNAFNNVDFAPPASVLFGPQFGNINSPTEFGRITSTVNPARVIQFALRYDF